jgi:hypothetical protein
VTWFRWVNQKERRFVHDHKVISLSHDGEVAAVCTRRFGGG